MSEVRTNVAEETAGRFDTVKEAAGGRFERSRLFLSEVRNELKRVTWPSQKEVYATKWSSSSLRRSSACICSRSTRSC